MFLSFQDINAFLMTEPVLTYPIRYIFFNSGLSNKAQLWFADDALVLLNESLYMFGNPVTLDRLLAQLAAGEYSFFGTPTAYLPLLSKHFTAIQRDEDCGAYTLSTQDFAPQILGESGSLEVLDAAIVDSHWAYCYPGSIEFFRHIIRNYPSSAVRINGQLAGWAVCYDATHDMVNLGSLKVLEPYRNRGLGKILAVSLAQKVLALGKTPMVHILDSNQPSQNLSLGLGFRRHRDSIFWGRGVKK